VVLSRHLYHSQEDLGLSLAVGVNVLTKYLKLPMRLVYASHLHRLICTQLGYDPIEKFTEEFILAESMLRTPKDKILPIGVGFLGWKLDDPKSTVQKQALDLVLARRVRAIWLSFGSNLGKYVRYIREHDEKANKSGTDANQSNIHKTVVIVVASSVEEAITAGKHDKADILVAQGM